jgi:hypothetical protein
LHGLTPYQIAFFSHLLKHFASAIFKKNIVEVVSYPPFLFTASWAKFYMKIISPGLAGSAGDCLVKARLAGESGPKG